MRPYDPILKRNARALRSSLTDAEQLLWSRLRRKQLLGVQFYRQKPIGPYIVDFYCAVAKLVIEIDGGQHFEEAHRRRDQKRDADLRASGLTVLRFDNLQVLKETEIVMEAIYRAVEQRIPPSPPFAKGGTGQGEAACSAAKQETGQNEAITSSASPKGTE